MTDGKGQYITQCYSLQFLLCVCVLFPRQSHIHIQLKKHSQNARQLLTPPVLLQSKWFHFFKHQRTSSGKDTVPVHQRHLSDELSLAMSLAILKWLWLPYKSTVSTWSFKKMLYCCLQ